MNLVLNMTVEKPDQTSELGKTLVFRLINGKKSSNNENDISGKLFVVQIINKCVLL